MMVVYHSDINPGAAFSPTVLSAAFGQVKYKNKVDTTAEQVIWPIGLSCWRTPGGTKQEEWVRQ